MRLKLVENAPQGHGKKQALIALNINELELLSGMALDLSQKLPKHGPTARLQQVSKQMHKEMEAAIKELETIGVDKKTDKRYPADDRAVL